MMQIKIYNGEAVIVLQDLKDSTELTNEYDGFEIIKRPNAKSLKALLPLFHNKMEANYLFQVKDVFEFFKKISDSFTSIEAAGGIVQNTKKEVLFIQRLGKWDLPKGKIEKGENPQVAAEREITEETGVKNLNLTEAICKTYHIYFAFEKWYLKTTYWFHFTTSGKQKLFAQAEENITEVKWIPTIDVKKPMANTYQNIKDVIATYFDKP